MRLGEFQFLALLAVVSVALGSDENKKAIDYPKRVKLEAKISIKKTSANMSINDVRQQISGYFLLQDQASIYDPPVGGLKGKYWIIGQTVGGWSTGGTGKFIVFQRDDWSAELPLKGSAQVSVKETSTMFDKTGSGKFGYEYYGYLLVIQDPSDKYIIIKSNKKEFEEGGPAFLQLEERMTFDKDFKPKARGSWYN